jgi:hypothetical protein
MVKNTVFYRRNRQRVHLNAIIGKTLDCTSQQNIFLSFFLSFLLSFLAFNHFEFFFHSLSLKITDLQLGKVLVESLGIMQFKKDFRRVFACILEQNPKSSISLIVSIVAQQ